MMQEFKALVTKVLTPHASAILLDPEWGLEASKQRARTPACCSRTRRAGTTTHALDASRICSNTGPCGALKEAGANCVKLLLYYTPFDTRAVNEEKHAFVERIGDECRTNDLPFFLEFVGYDAAGGDEKGPSSRKRNPRSSGPAWLSSRKIGTAWT